MASFKIIGGDIKAGTANVRSGLFQGPSIAGWGIKIRAADIASVETLTAEKQKTVLGTLGWGAAGGLMLGPLGAVGGMLLGGNKSRVYFDVKLKDGRHFIGEAKPKIYAQIAAMPRRG
jgi:hypothetical protein